MTIKKLETIPRLLWDCNYYDGILSGYCIYEDKLHYFNCVDENDNYWNDDESKNSDDLWYRRFNLYEVPQDEIDEVYRRHKVFQDNVGTHTDYNYDGNNRLIRVKSMDTHYIYYNAAKTWLPLSHTQFSKDKAVAYFEN